MWAQAWLIPTYRSYVIDAATEASQSNRYEYAPVFNLSSQVQPYTKKWIKDVRLDGNLETSRTKVHVFGKRGHEHGSNPPTVSTY